MPEVNVPKKQTHHLSRQGMHRPRTLLHTGHQGLAEIKGTESRRVHEALDVIGEDHAEQLDSCGHLSGLAVADFGKIINQVLLF